MLKCHFWPKVSLTLLPIRAQYNIVVNNIFNYFFSSIKWNFTKFIVDKNGQPVERHAANVNPLVI